MSVGHSIAMSLRAAYLAMHRQTEASLAPDGVTADQFVVLAVLAEEDRITQQALVRRTYSDPNTIGAMLVLMEKRGLIARHPHPTDGRARSVLLTRDGLDTYERLRARSQPVRRKLQRLFQPAEAHALLELLARIDAQLGQPSASEPKRSVRKRKEAGKTVRESGRK
jgi:DNA-binding MarR family transcriptional regulator